MSVQTLPGSPQGIARPGHDRGPGCLAECVPPADPVHSSRLLRASSDQVRVARAFVRARLAGHPACDDAVLAASELAANSVAHSASGRDGGMFLVQVAEVSATHAAVLICERRGPCQPAARDAGPGSESGRGLVVIRSLSCFFRVYDHGGMRAILVVVPAPPAME